MFLCIMPVVLYDNSSHVYLVNHKQKFVLRLKMAAINVAQNKLIGKYNILCHLK